MKGFTVDMKSPISGEVGLKVGHIQIVMMSNIIVFTVCHSTILYLCMYSGKWGALCRVEWGEMILHTGMLN